MEVDVVHLLATAEKVAEHRKRRGGDFGQQVENGFPDERPDFELRVVQAAGYRQVDINDAVAILEEGNGDFEGQVDRVGAFDTLAQFQLVDDEFVCGGELAIFNFVVDVDGQFAFLNFVAGKVTGVGGSAGELHALEVHFDVAVGRRGQRVGFAPNMDGGVAVNPALQFDFRARTRIGRQAED